MPGKNSRILRVPLGWVTAQGAGPVASMTAHVALWAAIMQGANLDETPYAEFLRARGKSPTRVAEILAMRAKQMAGPPSELPCPVKLTSLGRYELIDGHHRATRAVAENAEDLLVDVISVSPSWARLEHQLRALYPEKETYLYQPIEHPWFSAWATSRSPQRLEMVLATLGAEQPGNYIEVGSCTGSFARAFQRRGWRCFAADCDARVVAIAEYLDLVFGTSVGYWHCGLESAEWRSLFMGGDGWDLTVCLSVLHAHHTAGQVEWVAGHLRRLLDRSRLLLTDGDAPGREYGGGKAWPLDQYQSWLANVAYPTHRIEVLGATEGRQMYLLRRI